MEKHNSASKITLNGKEFNTMASTSILQPKPSFLELMIRFMETTSGRDKVNRAINNKFTSFSV